MLTRGVLRVLGLIVMAVGGAMLPPAILSFVDGSSDAGVWLLAAAVPMAVGGLTLLTTRGALDLRLRHGFVVVTFGWLFASLFGAVPYWLSGTAHPIDAFFESMSGFTTTGATIFADVESLSRALLLWRSLTQWLGGMGIVVLSVAILPMLGIGGMQLFRAEVPSPTTDRLAPRIQSTAKILWGVYLLLTVLEIGLLAAGRMSFFEAACHSFSTVSTGGFSTRNASVGSFASSYVDGVITVFMFFSGANFSLHFWMLRGHWRRYTSNEEFRYYLAIVVALVAVVSVVLQVRFDEAPLRALQLAAFQVTAIVSTTGFGTADFLLWGADIQLLFFLLMFVGASAGSTTGGMKLMRVILLVKHGLRELQKQLHPQAIFNVRLSGKLVPDQVMMVVLGFFLLFVCMFSLVALAIAMLGVEPITAFGASIATLSNIGPGLGQVGPSSHYGAMPDAAKLLLGLNMLIGRLELFTVLVLLTPMFWRRA